MGIRFTDATPALRLAPLPLAAPQASSSSGVGGVGGVGGEGGEPGEVDVWIDPGVDQRVLAHLRAHDVEQGGLLVGRPYGQPEGHPACGLLAHVRITGCAPAEDAESTAFSLRMGSRVWQAAQALLGPEDLIVGWYHSHPGLTAFFSDTDRQTQRAFFSNTYSIGWVIDPTDGDEALFLGGDCTPVRRGPNRSGG